MHSGTQNLDEYFGHGFEKIIELTEKPWKWYCSSWHLPEAPTVKNE
jgi:hypothetical protein